MSATKDIGISTDGAVGIVAVQRPAPKFLDNSANSQIAGGFEGFRREHNNRSMCSSTTCRYTIPSPE